MPTASHAPSRPWSEIAAIAFLIVFVTTIYAGRLTRLPIVGEESRWATAAREMLGDSVSVYLDGGPTPGIQPSSIVDVTGKVPVLLREGALSAEQLREVVPDLEVAP